MKTILFETIVSSLSDALVAEAAGADRFEVCSALSLGGLTPSLGTIKQIKAHCTVPAMYMVRPRQGGMAYSEHEFTVMRTDAELALESGADGLVFGFLTEQGDIREDHCREFVRLCEQASTEKPVQTTFHRAFDITRQPGIALEKLIDLGVQRILTSGHAPEVIDALPAIRKLANQANGRIQIMPGGGIDESNVQQVIRETGLNEFHLYLPTEARDYSALHNPDIYFGSEEKELEYPIVSEERVREVRRLINELTAR